MSAVTPAVNQSHLIPRESHSVNKDVKVTSIPGMMPLLSHQGLRVGRDDNANSNALGIPTPTGRVISETIKAIANEALQLTRGDSLSYSGLNAVEGTVPVIKHVVAPDLRPLPLPTSQRLRLNKFVRRLHDMLVQEKDSGVVEWRRGLLVLHSTEVFAKTLLPKYFNTRNFKTFRRQLNYYGFIHVRSFSTTGSTTTALWVNHELASSKTTDVNIPASSSYSSSLEDDHSVESVLTLKRVEPCESAKTTEGRRVRKEQAIHTVEEDLGVNARSLQMDQIRSMALRLHDDDIGMITRKDCASILQRSPTAFALPPPPFALLSASLGSVMVKEDDKANAANLLLMLSKSG